MIETEKELVGGYLCVCVCVCVCVFAYIVLMEYPS